MSKKARNQRRSLATVEEAVALVKLARRMADYVHLPADGPLSVRVQRQAGGICRAMLQEWDKTRLVLRCDPEFASALLDTDRDTLVPATCFERSPWQSIMVSFQPFDLHDGQDLCRYYGLVLAGSTTKPTIGSAPSWLTVKADLGWTKYGAVSAMEAVRFSWLFMFRETNLPGLQTITVPWRGEFAHGEQSVAQLIESFRESYQYSQQLPGHDLDVLVPLSINLLLYLGSAEPDIDRPIVVGGDGNVTAKALTGVKVANMGFRVGSAIRGFKERGPSHSHSIAGPGLRRLPPHIRSAHWHRFRVAARDTAGQVVGNRSGQRNLDWHYILKWLPPTPVNVGDKGPQPTIREVS